MGTESFHPLIRRWFDDRFGRPTEPQELGWPLIASGRHTLIAAPTGSGKTLAAFLVCLDQLLRAWIDGRLEESVHTVYISPLKALSNDIERNLQTPLEEIQKLAELAGFGIPPIRARVRTGDTPSSERQAMLRNPPQILVTTPESLYLMLTAQKSREILRTVRTVIVDEIHALARDKRGSHLALSLERLAELCDCRPVRIGLSATQRPIDDIARFLVGTGTQIEAVATDGIGSSIGSESADSRTELEESAGYVDGGCQAERGSIRTITTDGVHGASCAVVDIGHVRKLDLAVETTPSELSAVCSHEQWDEIYHRVTELIAAHRSTLIFVNTRRMAERISHRLTEMLGEESVACHHGSLSRALRLSAERRLKAGDLRAIVATASLEMGIDIGYIDLVCQIGSPRSIATFLQRVGRSGHSLGAIPKGRLIPLTRDELLECMALVRSVRGGQLDSIEIPQSPLDILAQQIVAAVACEPWDERLLFDLCRRAWPYRQLSHDDFAAIVSMLSDGVAVGARHGKYLHRDRLAGHLRPTRGARLAALTSGGAIPETAEYRVVTEGEKTFVGTVDEDFAIESLAGDIFLLGNTSWRIRRVQAGEVIVQDAQGAPPSIPFWFGEAPGRTVELSANVSQLRGDIAERLAAESPPGDWLQETCRTDGWGAQQAVHYVEAQVAAIGMVPTQAQIVFERFFDESGGMQLVIHAPLGARINRAWGLALRKRFCRSFDFELQAVATDNGIVLSLSPQHSFPIESLFRMLGSHNARSLLEQALLAVPMFQVRWRWNVTRALAVLRMQNGRKVPPYLQRFRADDLLAATFPETVGCLENHHGDVVVPDHPLVRQTMHDCLHEAMDLNRWLELLANVRDNRVQFVARDTREPSPFSHELLNANPYAFLDGAPLEERRTRAVVARRSHSLAKGEGQDLGQLDELAISQVREQAWPLVRSADELHDALMSLVVVDQHEAATWGHWFEDLLRSGRATRLRLVGSSGTDRATRLPCESIDDERVFWIAAERWPLVRSLYDAAVADPTVVLPGELDRAWSRGDAVVELVRGRTRHGGPMSASQLASAVGLNFDQISAALEALEGQGSVLRGQFTSAHGAGGGNGHVEWCDRRLLARIHRLTLDGLRQRIKPVDPEIFLRFLVRHHHLHSDGDGHSEWGGPVGVQEAVGQLQGFELPAGAWERYVLAPRVTRYDPQWLDQLFLSGQALWGRLRVPRRDTSLRASMSIMTRSVPVSLLLRDDLPWLLPEALPCADDSARANARAVLAALDDRGALFFQELSTATGLLPAHLEEALRELSALGLVTSDGFSALRSMVEPVRSRRGRRHRMSFGSFGRVSHREGRWCRFPGQITAVAREGCLERWCAQLLRRYGILFRELLTREAAAPAWHDLLPILRRMELRGELRGGRFVSGVAGEQFALETTTQELRKLRDEMPDEERWVVISAADPLNLVGIVTDGPRVPATHKNALILSNGRCVAAKLAGTIEFHEEVGQPARADMRRALQLGRADVEMAEKT